MEIDTKTKTPLFSTESQTFENSDCLCARNWSNFVTGYQTTGWSRRNSDISARFCCWSFSKSIDSLKSFVELKWLMNIFNTCWTNAGCKSKIGVRFDLVSYHFKCDWLDPNGGSVPFHHLTKQRLATIENYWKTLGSIVVGPKTIVKPLGPMVGGAIEKQWLLFYRLTNG